MTENELIKALERKIYCTEKDDELFADCVNIKILKSALDIINRQKEEIKKLKDALKDKLIHADIICYSKKEYEEYDSAIEKQIAKEPIPLLNVYPDGQYECSCDCPVLRCYSYCPKCGQKLDWSDVK